MGQLITITSGKFKPTIVRISTPSDISDSLGIGTWYEVGWQTTFTPTYNCQIFWSGKILVRSSLANQVWFALTNNGSLGEVYCRGRGYVTANEYEQIPLLGSGHGASVPPFPYVAGITYTIKLFIYLEKTAATINIVSSASQTTIEGLVVAR